MANKRQAVATGSTDMAAVPKALAEIDREPALACAAAARAGKLFIAPRLALPLALDADVADGGDRLQVDVARPGDEFIDDGGHLPPTEDNAKLSCSSSISVTMVLPAWINSGGRALRYEYFYLVEAAFEGPATPDKVRDDSIRVYMGTLSDFLKSGSGFDHLKDYVGAAEIAANRAQLMIHSDVIKIIRDYASSLNDPEDILRLGCAMLSAIAVESNLPTENGPQVISQNATAYVAFKATALINGAQIAQATSSANESADKAHEAAASLIKIQAVASETLNDVSERSRVVAQDVQSTSNNLDTLHKNTLDRTTILENKLAMLTATGESLSKTVDATSEGVDRFIKAVRETLGQKDTKDLWGKRAITYRVQFIASLAAILVLIAGLPAFALYHSEDLVDTIIKINKKLADASAGTDPTIGTTIAILNRLLVFGFPAALYVWLVKFFIRYNQHSLLLADDAATRSTIMDMYVKLIEVDAAKPEDRTPVIAALLRPTVGQATDNVDLPIVEAIKALKP